MEQGLAISDSFPNLNSINSVIDHLYSWEKQKHFASEIWQKGLVHRSLRTSFFIEPDFMTLFSPFR